MIIGPGQKSEAAASVQFFFVSKVGPKKRKEGRRQVRNLAARWSRSQSVVTPTSFLPFPLQTWKVVSPSVLPFFRPNCPSSFFCHRTPTLSRVSSLRSERPERGNSGQHQLYEVASPREYSPSTAPRTHRQMLSLTLDSYYKICTSTRGCMRSLWFWSTC